MIDPGNEVENSLEFPNSTRNIRKCSNKLMTNTFGEINSQSKQDINVCHSESEIRHVSALFGSRNIFFSVCYVPFESNVSIKQEKCISHALKTK